MTQEEKAKRYDDLLVKLQEAKVDNDVCDERYCCVIDDIVPELKESEDEKIRKELIAEVKEQIDCIPAPDCRDKEDEKALKQLNKWLAWLEKQGEQNLANSAKTCKDEQKPNPCDGCINRKGCINCENGELREVEQKPADNEMIEILRTEYEKGRADAIVEIQKSALSEEDEAVLNALIRSLEGEHVYVSSHLAIECLKHLKERYTWKPSDEQMGVIEAVINNRSFQRRHLDSLYADLKRLRKE